MVEEGSLVALCSCMDFSIMSSSHGLQFLMNCSSMGPFHEVKSFGNSISLFPNEATSPARKPAPVWASHRVTAFFRASTCSGGGPSMGRGISALAFGALPPPSLYVCGVVSVTYAHFSLLGCNCCCTGGFFLIKIFYPRGTYCHF